MTTSSTGQLDFSMKESLKVLESLLDIFPEGMGDDPLDTLAEITWKWMKK